MTPYYTLTGETDFIVESCSAKDMQDLRSHYPRFFF